MSNELHDQIYGKMNSKATDELLAIWQANNRVVWSDIAFQVIEQILTQRLGSVPAQNEPIFADDVEDAATADEDDLEEWEAKLLDAEDQPEFYDTLEVVSLMNLIDKAAKATIILNVIMMFAYFPASQNISLGVFPSTENLPTVALSLLKSVLIFGIGILITYFPLKALSYILRILMEMEFNSRKPR